MKNFLKFWLIIAILAMLTNCGHYNTQDVLECDLSWQLSKIKSKIERNEIKAKSGIRIAYLELEEIMMRLDSLEEPRRKNIQRDVDYVVKRLDILSEDFDYEDKTEKRDGVTTTVDTISMIQKYLNEYE